MSIKEIVEKIEKRVSIMSKSPEYDAHTYNLCKSFQTFYITGLMSEKVYKKHIDFVLDVKYKIFDYYKNDSNPEDCDIFSFIISK